MSLILDHWYSQRRTSEDCDKFLVQDCSTHLLYTQWGSLFVHLHMYENPLKNRDCFKNGLWTAGRREALHTPWAAAPGNKRVALSPCGGGLSLPAGQSKAVLRIRTDPHWFGSPGSGSREQRNWPKLTNKPEIQSFKKALYPRRYGVYFYYFQIKIQLFLTAKPD